MLEKRAEISFQFPIAVYLIMLNTNSNKDHCHCTAFVGCGLWKIISQRIAALKQFISIYFIYYGYFCGFVYIYNIYICIYIFLELFRVTVEQVSRGSRIYKQRSPSVVSLHQTFVSQCLHCDYAFNLTIAYKPFLSPLYWCCCNWKQFIRPTMVLELSLQVNSCNRSLK